MSAQDHAIHEAISQLQQLTELFQKRRVQLAESVGITEQQWNVLEEISTEHFIPSLFAKQRESSAAAVSKTLRQLTDKELVIVSLSTADARQRNYELTQRGKKLMEKLRRQRQDAIECVWQQFSTQELSDFGSFATRLGGALKIMIAQAGQY